MVNRGVSVSYGDIAPGAKENFVPSTNYSEFNTLEQLNEYNLNFLNYGNPCELYQTVLDGSAIPLPTITENVNVGVWSSQVSSPAQGNFEYDFKIVFRSEERYTSQGIGLTFDTDNGIFPTHISLTWSRIVDGIGEDLITTHFYPDSPVYFCQQYVEAYNKLTLTVFQMNMPVVRLKLRAIDYGYGTVFFGDELRDVKLIQEIDPISSQISINTVDITLDSKSDINYSFQAKQPLSVYFNDELKATTFVRSSKRKSKSLWEIKGEDYISLMDSMQFYGNMYSDANVVDVLNGIFGYDEETGETIIPYEILDESIKSETITGHIPICTSREALMQVAFAIQAVVDTSNSDVVKIFRLEDNTEPTIPLNRIMQGQNFVDDETVTDVEVVLHRYEPKEIIDDNRVLGYNARESGIGENIFVKFSEPLHGLYTTNAEPDELIEYNANYAIVSPKKKSFRLIGYGYEHIMEAKRQHNEIVTKGEPEKIVAIENATLVSPSNIDNVLEKCYNWLIKSTTTNMKIVEGKNVQEGGVIQYGELEYGTFEYKEKMPDIVTYDKPVNVGDLINAETEYLGVVNGRLIKQTFNLNGGIIVKEAVIK